MVYTSSLMKRLRKETKGCRGDRSWRLLGVDLEAPDYKPGS